MNDKDIFFAYNYAELESRVLGQMVKSPSVSSSAHTNTSIKIFRMPVYEDPNTLRMYARLRKEEGLSSAEAKKTIELVTGDKPNDIVGSGALSAWGDPSDNNGLPFYHHRRRF